MILCIVVDEAGLKFVKSVDHLGRQFFCPFAVVRCFMLFGKDGRIVKDEQLNFFEIGHLINGMFTRTRIILKESIICRRTNLNLSIRVLNRFPLVFSFSDI